MPPRLEMIGIDKAFAGVPVLRDVDLSVGVGEVVALLGANGAGKSTLMKILGGIYHRDSGEIRVDGKPVAMARPQDAVAAGIRLLPQEISVHSDLSVAENICIGSLPVRNRLGLTTIDRGRMRHTARDLLDRLGMGRLDPDRMLGTLAVSQRRVVEIARALAGDARLLVMDEPTASMAEAEAELLFGIVETLRTQGVSVVYISHYLDEVFRLADRIVVLRDGVVSGTFSTRQTSHAQVLEAMLGSTLGDLFPPKQGTPRAGAPVLQVEGLSLTGWLDDLSLQVGAGEVVGLCGLIGSGIERVGRAVFGAEGATVRAASLGGRPFRPTSPQASVAAGIGFVAAERKREGLVGILPVRANTTLSFLDRFVRRGQVDRAAETHATRHWIEALGVRTSGPEQEIRLLSGGNQQKICLARWMLGDIKLLILEEPTRGVDLGARREIYAQIRKLAAEGIGLMVVSSDAEEVAGLVDRTIVLHHGRAVATLDAQADAAQILAACSIVPKSMAPEMMA